MLAAIMYSLLLVLLLLFGVGFLLFAFGSLVLFLLQFAQELSLTFCKS